MLNVPCLPCQREKPHSIIGQAGGSAGRAWEPRRCSPSNRVTAFGGQIIPRCLLMVYGTRGYILMKCRMPGDVRQQTLFDCISLVFDFPLASFSFSLLLFPPRLMLFEH